MGIGQSFRRSLGELSEVGGIRVWGGTSKEPAGTPAVRGLGAIGLNEFQFGLAAQSQLHRIAGRWS
jgi:hypothetical protein